jgi:hypothetical protein
VVRFIAWPKKIAEFRQYYNPLEMLIPLGFSLSLPQPAKPEEKKWFLKTKRGVFLGERLFLN